MLGMKMGGASSGFSNIPVIITSLIGRLSSISFVPTFSAIII